MSEIEKNKLCEDCGNPIPLKKGQIWVDGRRKYCDECAEKRKRSQDATRMKELRKEWRSENQRIRQENCLLKARNEELEGVIKKQAEMITRLRERVGVL